MKIFIFKFEKTQPKYTLRVTSNDLKYVFYIWFRLEAQFSKQIESMILNKCLIKSLLLVTKFEDKYLKKVV